MDKTILSTEDYEQIIYFAAQIARPTDDIRSKVLQELDICFGYDKTIFWKTDENGTITDPASYRVNDNFIYHYLDEFKDQDVLNPKKNLNLYHEQKVLRIADLLTRE